MNTFGIFDDWKKRVRDNPVYKSIYDYGGNLQDQYGGTGLLDFGSAASKDALKTAGGVIDKSADYTLGKERAVSPPSTYGSKREEVARPGFTKSKFYKDIKNIPLDVRFPKSDPSADPTVTPFDPSQGGDTKTNVPQDPKWWEKLANMAGVDPTKAAASWKDKGGFEGLMSNPAFTMGLAFMQASAEGKTIGQGALDNVMKAAGISSHYKKILKDRQEEPIQATSGDIAEVKSLLSSLNVSSPSNLEKFWGAVKGIIPGKKSEKVMFKWDLAAEDIAIELQKEIKKLKKNKKPGAPEVVYDTPMKLKIIKRMLDEGRFKKKGGTWFTDATLESTKPIPLVQGGQIQAGQPAIVGEDGPEYFLPQESGKVLSNDDSRIFSMLLSANPQLQNVSRTRSEKILRNRFPEYFE